MSRLVLNPELRSKLNGLQEQMEICDDSGKILGHFIPEPLYRDLLVAWSKANLSDEELERRRQEPPGRTLAEIWQSLSQS